MSARRVFVAGHAGMVGQALCRALTPAGYEVITRDRNQLDLRNSTAVTQFLQSTQPDQVIIAAAKVGGIHANQTYPADFIFDNLMIATNLIDGAHRADINQLLFLGSSCAYPKFANQPISEDQLLSGDLEPTNEPYAIAKIAGIKLCESYNRQHGRDYRSLMPTNLYGPGDNFHPTHSHVLPALLRRFHEATHANQPTVSVWGSGKARREFLHVDDLADACRFTLGLNHKQYQSAVLPMRSHVNVGTGIETPISELASLIAKTVDFQGHIEFDLSQPEGTPRKRLDVSLMDSLGWKSTVPLKSGLADTYRWFCKNQNKLKER